MSIELVARILSVAIGIIAALWILSSAARTTVLPRPERVWLTTTSFRVSRRIALWLSRRADSPEGRHRILGTFAPLVLISLPVLWSVGLLLSFSLIFWGWNAGSFAAAVELSGSSLTTLGFIEAPTFVSRMFAILEALFGLALIALLISFLPTLYSTFSRREIAVGRLTTRAGEPPTPREFLVRLNAIDRLDQAGDRWEEWEQWFVELGETHTTFPALIYFRSARPGRSWLTAAETALDTAALVTSTQLVPSTGQAETMIRSGYLALRAIADFYEIEPEDSPKDRTQLAVTELEFNELLDELVAGGLHIEADRAQAWHDFEGWRVNYDRALTGLKELVGDVPTHWSLGAAHG